MRMGDSNFSHFVDINIVYSESMQCSVKAQELVGALCVLEVLGPVVHVNLLDQLTALLSCLLACLKLQYTAVRHMAGT